MESENQAPDSRLHNTISLDPGCRTFISGYDADGTLIEWGKVIWVDFIDCVLIWTSCKVGVAKLITQNVIDRDSNGKKKK
jgi:hypothetical protein